jgi:quercetin dioxygenase-like cupin family protein
MKRSIVLTLALLAIGCSQNQTTPSHATDHTSAGAMTQHGMFRPDQISWKDGPPSLPPGAKFAVLEGDPSKEGYFAMRAMLPDGYRIPAHWHPAVERLTVLSGTLYLGVGDSFNESDADAMPAGTYAYMPAGMRHFAYTKGTTILQLTTLGPWGVTYVNPADDPRQKK